MYRKVIPRNRRFVYKSPLMFGAALHLYKVVTVIEFVSFITNFYPFQFGFVIGKLIIYDSTSSFKFGIFVHHPKGFCGRLSARSDYCYELSYQFYKKFVLLFRYYEPYIFQKCLNIIILFMSLPSSSLLQNLSLGQSLSAVHPVIHFSIWVFVFGQTYL